MLLLLHLRESHPNSVPLRCSSSEVGRLKATMGWNNCLLSEVLKPKERSRAQGEVETTRFKVESSAIKVESNSVKRKVIVLGIKLS